MSNLQLITNEQIISPLENKLYRMRELSSEIKALEAEYNMLKQEMIATYFVANEEYRTNKGLLLASYKSQEQIQFQQTKFKQDHIDIYEMYSEKKIIWKFLVK